jgi:hypothetical protein
MNLKLTVFSVLFVCVTLSFGPAAHADEGMWTFNNFPSKNVAQNQQASEDEDPAQHGKELSF